MGEPPDGSSSYNVPSSVAMSASSQLPPHGSPSSSSETLLTSSSRSSSSSGPNLTTPELQPHDHQLPPVFHSHSPNTSPSGSTTSTAHSKGESTPRAEISAPVWPLSTASDITDVYEEPSTMTGIGPSFNEQPPTVSRSSSLKRGNSWRKKHASLDTPPTAPRHDPSFPSFTSLSQIPPLSQPPQSDISSPVIGPPATQAPSTAVAYAEARRFSRGSQASTSSQDKWTRAHSPSSGCQISAPISPPVGYPLSFYSSGRRNSSSSGLAPPASSAASTASSSSGRSSGRNISTPPQAPRWAQPPAVTNSYSGRALSFGSGQSRPDINVDDFDPELLEGAEDEWIEMIKGSEGRIAIKSTPSVYDIMVWLPGFSIDNITIATRGHRTVHIVADQWDEGDHAQWDIKLGEDANLKSVNAKFTGKELRVTVARQLPEWQIARNLRLSNAATKRPNPCSGPSITATNINPLERATAARSRV
ncbi:hypothetical protein CNBN1470 [Cryptococcus deneoformans B-3501A]|uniref:SHSP domain-containing protein n=1 Tax=Cryptococcus deneoformans (strain JEC21 / ATCC MYA-565) TaxID=214684 RepID=Q5K711_CRYD1|nr:hypothetical protein CNN01510 [Cryptococcus neoformans var. neoformans JEC21]XP_771967.1 hypothetical protein CNBN1470 [Cryptococcus neoformans var. neoformans B-3501A]AAW47106.1 hypothetical protein CNN01510 [Cryptococcus neoformans var. neoformans JEC21]EAL17320.1 hypothetical protein CNBN1470 [Cryptococcus neoformans var. neoformans B-3501A]